MKLEAVLRHPRRGDPGDRRRRRLRPAVGAGDGGARRCRASSTRATSRSSATSRPPSWPRSSSASTCSCSPTATRPPEEVVEAARAARVNLIVSPLDSYVSARMIQLAVPVGRIMDAEPLTVGPDDVLEDVTPEILEVDYRTAVVVDGRRRPIGLVGRSALVGPAPRKVVLVDHAEESQSAPGIEQAEIVEILDHHHIGSIETHLPVRATFDPVGSTATLVAERFAAARHRALAARPRRCCWPPCSRTPSCSPLRRSRTATGARRRRWGSRSARNPRASGGRCSRPPRTSPASQARRSWGATPRPTSSSGSAPRSWARSRSSATSCSRARASCATRSRPSREEGGHAIAALMVTDIVARATTLFVAGDVDAVERAFGERGRGRRDRPARRDEPQEAGRAEDHGRVGGREVRRASYRR